jgi:hypothetical protein
MESQEKSAVVQTQGGASLGAVSSTISPPVAPGAGMVPTPAGERDAKSTRHASPEHSPDRRFERRRANQRRARAGHRRNIRRSNTNG